jgi:hypothetical protein
MFYTSDGSSIIKSTNLFIANVYALYFSQYLMINLIRVNVIIIIILIAWLVIVFVWGLFMFLYWCLLCNWPLSC